MPTSREIVLVVAHAKCALCAHNVWTFSDRILLPQARFVARVVINYKYIQTALGTHTHITHSLFEFYFVVLYRFVLGDLRVCLHSLFYRSIGAEARRRRRLLIDDFPCFLFNAARVWYDVRPTKQTHSSSSHGNVFFFFFWRGNYCV